MSRLRRLMTASALALAVSAPVGVLAQDTSALTDAQKDAVRALVRDTLVNDPDILREAFAALQAQEEKAQAARQAEALKTHAKALYESPTDPVLGNPKGDVTVVEFLDYRCGYCKSVMDTVMDVVKEDGNVRFVIKEFPILGPESVVAARYALAARAQGKYAPFHQALMKHRGAFTDESVRQIAKETGLNVDKLVKDAEDPALQKELLANRALAEALGISGTPAFAMGTILIPGALNADTLKQAIAATRKANKG
ncbi:DsbA family protein [Novispirillum sp. DQ9]|uniref:DsbA family protein n=1 Tax=Novispirillum sp. DQ9 TaxID=3398612 RepID=UPI003C7A4CCA